MIWDQHRDARKIAMSLQDTSDPYFIMESA